MAVVAAVVPSDPQALRHLDHTAFLRALEAMHRGRGFYDAYVAGCQASGIRLDHVRGFRQPWLLLALRPLPLGWLRPTFAVVVVGIGGALTSALSRRAIAGPIVASYLATVGILGRVDAWMLFELWAVPLLLASLLARQRRHPVLAVTLGVAACLVRETATLLLLGYCIDALLRRDRREALLALRAMGVAVSAFVVHLVIAAGHTVPTGNEATLAGTGSPGAVLRMVSAFPLVSMGALDALGALLWVAALVVLVRSRLRPALPLALLPVLGLLVDRPYWGILVVPIVVVALCDVGATAGPSRTAGGAVVGSSPLPRTPRPGPGSPAGAPAPPSG
jgi:hypothetical protein